jgi:MerR family transcriptional regulator, light-induced transcriptional regulator
VNDSLSNEATVEETFTPKQIAQALQVSESSVKRWCDRGVIRTERTLGGHRRISLAQLREFLETTNRRVLDPKAIGIALVAQDTRVSRRDSVPAASSSGSFDGQDRASLRESFERALISGDEVEARRVVSTWYSAGDGIVSVADDLIAPAFRSIGSMWACGDIEVYQERRGCEICNRIIHELRRLMPEPVGYAPMAMGGTSVGDQYQIPNQLVDMVFRENGWRSINLGTNLPFSSMLSAARKHMPKIFWLSVSYVEDEETFVSECAHFAQHLPKGVVFVAGGFAIHEELRKRLAYSSYCDNMAQLSNLARTIKAAIPGPGRTI